MLISLLLFGTSPEMNQPMKNLAGWSYGVVTAFCPSIRFCFESAAAPGKRTTCAAAQMVT